MTGDCWPDRLVGTVPHFYYYYIVNPSEAMIAKRRSLATLISYRAPELKKSDLYGDFQELKEMIGEYRESLQSAPERCGDLLENIGVQFDPRLVSTRTAWERGQKAGRNHT